MKKTFLTLLSLTFLLFISIGLISCGDETCTHADTRPDYDPYYHSTVCTQCGETVSKEEHTFRTECTQAHHWEYFGTKEISEFHNCTFVEEYILLCDCGFSKYQQQEPVGHDIVEGRCTRCDAGPRYVASDYCFATVSHLSPKTDLKTGDP